MHTMELGDFSVTYRVAGLLSDVKNLISARSRLRAAAMDALHRGGVEIVSPTFMNTRAFEVGKQFIPKPTGIVKAEEAEATKAEQLAFDKADEAESQEIMLLSHDKIVNEISKVEELIKESEDEAEKARLERRRARLDARTRRYVGRSRLVRRGGAGEERRLRRRGRHAATL